MAVRDKVDGLLSHIVALEERFNSLPGDLAEQRRRSEVIQYAVAPPVVLSAEFLSGNSRTSKDDCGFCLKSLKHGKLPTLSKTMGKLLGSSKIYGRLSSLIRSVCAPCAISNANVGNRWHNNWRSMSKGVN